MSRLKTFITRFVGSEEGLTTVEYAVAGALITAAGAAAFTNLGAAVTQRVVALAGLF